MALEAIKSVGVSYSGKRTIVIMLNGNTTECLPVGDKRVKLSCLVSPMVVCNC